MRSAVHCSLVTVLGLLWLSIVEQRPTFQAETNIARNMACVNRYVAEIFILLDKRTLKEYNLGRLS